MGVLLDKLDMKVLLFIFVKFKIVTFELNEVTGTAITFGFI